MRSTFCVLAFLALPMSSLAQQPSASPFLVDSPWPTHHGGSAKQSSTTLPGPVSATPDIQLRFFKDDIGRLIGTSPFHVLSRQKYRASPTSRTIWGATLTDVYKYEIDGEVFRYADSFKINALPFWIGWNLIGLDGDRVVVPNPSGLRLGEYRDEPCYGKVPSLLVFSDGESPDSPIRCLKKFEFTEDVLEDACGFRKTTVGSTAVINAVTFTGEVAVSLVRELRRNGKKRKESWLALVDNDLNELVACARVGETTISNMIPSEQGGDGLTVMYVATETELVEMVYDAVAGSLVRRAAVVVGYRSGRTGTTPTLLGFAGQDRFIISVDARCATANVFTGAISCDSEYDGPSQLVAIRRPLNGNSIVRFDLPDFIDTVENSPSVFGNDIVFANYSGYTPDGKRDGKKDFAKGVVKLSWNPETDSFQTDWARPDIQVNSILTISDSANRVYGSGAEEDGYTYFYAFRLRNDESGKAGELLTRARVGMSRNSRRRSGDGVFDAGNNVVINDDGSAIWPGGEVLVRIAD